MKKFTLPLFFCLFLYSLSPFCQPVFQRTYGSSHTEHPTVSIQTSDKGFALLGYENIGYGNLYLVKIDSAGNKVWSTQYVIPSTCVCMGNGQGYLAQTRDKGYIICNGTLLIKTDSLGNVIWAKDYSPSYYIGMFTRIIEVHDGYVITGGGMVLMKTDTVGNIKWTITNTDGGWMGDMVQSTYDSCYYVINHYGLYKIYKIDKNGKPVWEKQVSINHSNQPSTNGSSYYDAEIKQSPDGKLLGASISIYDNTEAWFTFDTSGTVIQSKQFTMAIGTYYEPCFWTFFPGGNSTDLIVTTRMDSLVANISDVWLSRIDTSGTLKWAERIGGHKAEYPACIRGTTDGYAYVLGSTESFGEGSSDLYFIKADTTGNTGCSAISDLYGFKFIPQLITLNTSTATYGTIPHPGYSVPTLVSASINDSSFNTCVCHLPHAAFTYQGGSGAIYDSSLWATEWYWSFGDGNKDSINVPLTSYVYDTIGHYTICLTVKNQCGTDSVCHPVYYNPWPIGVKAITGKDKINISPNPSSGIFNVRIDKPVGMATVVVYNILGEEVFSLSTINSEFFIDLNSHPNGIYLCRITDENGKPVVSTRLIKEN